MSATLGVGFIVIGVALFLGACVLILLGSISLVGFKRDQELAVFFEYVRIVFRGTDDPAKRVGARQTRTGWALALLGMLSIAAGMLVIASA